MKAYGISIAEGARITNVAVAAGESFPSGADEGELFFRYDADPTVRGLHCFTGGTWDRVGSTDAMTAPSGASFPGTANTGDLFYKNSNDAEERAVRLQWQCLVRSRVCSGPNVHDHW